MTTDAGPKEGLIRGLLNEARARPGLTAAVVALGIGLAVFVLIWFQPQKLFIDSRTDEGLPEGAKVLTGAPFSGLAHPTSGTAQIVELANGEHLLRLSNFQSDNGPDLFVYLSAAPPDADSAQHDDDFASLGPLKANIGDQNYEIPGAMDISSYQSVVIWCKRFSVGFGVAPLNTR